MIEKHTMLKAFIFRLLFFLLFVNQNLFCQSAGSKWYNMDDGLPQNSVKDIIKDKYGFFWLSTENGIVKYDGNKFEVYNDFPTKTLNFEYFRGDIEKDSIIVFCGNEDLPILIKKRTPEISYKKNIPKPLILTKNSGHVVINKNLFFNGVPSYFLNYAFYFKNSKYLFYAQKTFLIQNGKSKEIKMPSDFNNVKDLPNIFSFDEKIFIINKKTKKINTLFNGELSEFKNNPSIFYEKDAKIYWQQLTNQTFVILNNKIYEVSYNNTTIGIEFLTEYTSFDTDQIQSIFYDKKYSKLYLGSITKGLKILPVNQFYTSQDHSKYADNVYYATLPFSKNSVITEGGKIYDRHGIINQKKFEKKPYKRSIMYDDDLNIIYPKRSTILRHLKSANYLRSDSITSKNPMARVNVFGNKIVASYYDDPQTKFFCIYNQKGKKEFELQLNIDETPAIIENFDPGFYILGNTKNLFWFSIDKRKITYKLSFNIGLKQIQKLGNDLYLLTTFRNGPYILKNKKLIKLPLDSQKNIATAHIALEDSKGNFWITSNNGLYKIRKQNILDFLNHKRKDLYYYAYSKDDGLVNNEFNGTSYPCANKLQNGEFVFPSMEGLVFFKPDDVKSHYPTSQDLYLERARSENKIVEFKNKLFLPSDYKAAEILVDVPYYGNFENINLEYKFDDDKNWKKVNNKTINLAGLSFGKHDLTVRMLISGEGKFTYKKIKVEVEPKFYQTIWFNFLAVVTLILLILIIIHSRTRLLKSKNNVLRKTVIEKAKELDESLKNLQENQRQLSDRSEYEKKIIENIIHDITTPVRFIALISQQLTDTIDPETQKEYFESLHASSEQLHKYTLNLKDYTQIYKEDTYYKDEYYSLTDFVNEKKLLFHEIALHNNTIITNETDHDITINIKKSFINMILHNLIDNAVKNTFDGYITVTGYLNSDKNVILEIKDTGTGMQDHDIEYYNNLFSINRKISDPKYKSSLGLYLVSQVSKKINLEITFLKNQPKGTIVKLILKHKKY